MNLFNLHENQTTVSRELLAGLVTFATMAYILCVQPALMSGQMVGQNTGMNVPALITTTCLASAVGCFLMGFLARYPIALAPGMGNNFFVVLELFPACAAVPGMAPGCGVPEVWMLGMGVVFLSGLLFLILSLLKVRNHLLNVFSLSMKMAICAGIGLFIAWLGLKNSTLLQITNNQPALGSFVTWDAAIFLVGFFVSTVLMIRKFPGALLIGILASALTALCVGKLQIHGIVSLPANPLEIVGKADVKTACAHLVKLLPFVFILTFMDVFDTFGTMLGVAHCGNFVQKDGSVPRIERVFLADATATMLGSLCGHSTVTAFIESTAGVESGGRTGLTAIFVGVLFLIALFFSPLIMAVAGCAPITASALILVGILMAGSLKKIQWDDLTEAVPAFLIVVGVPFFNSISNGILCGAVVYPFLKILAGRRNETNVGMFVLAGLLIAYVFIR